MTAYVDIAIRSSVVVLVALAVATLLHRRSAAVRHWVLAIGIFGAVAVLPLSRALPGWDLPVTAIASGERTTSTNLDPAVAVTVTEPTAGSPLDGRAFTGTVVAVWGAGVAVSLAIMAIGIVRLRRQRSRAATITTGPWHRIREEISARYGLVRPVVLLETEGPHTLAMWGVWRPQVLLPAQAMTWTPERARIVLGHELAHVKRGDWPVQLAADLVRAAFWFNPLFWIACAELRRESEHACDDVVLETGVVAADYAAHLVDIVRKCRPVSPGYTPAMSMARPSTLERRVTAMLNHRLDRTRPSSRARLVIAALLLAGVAIPAATFRAAAQETVSALTGTVYDPTGAVLPQVEVTLENQQSVQRRVMTDSAGHFEFEPIPAGRYVLETALLGFKSSRQEIALKETSDWSRAITLQVGTLEESITITAARPLGVTPAAEPGRPIGGNIRVPRKLVDVKPIYPAAMRESGLEGMVTLDALIGVDGSVLSARVASPQVHPDFVNAAIEAVRQWRFSPTLLNGVPIEVSMKVSVRFSLAD